MTSEEKLLEKIRKVLIADTTLEAYVKSRVYASHISSIAEPKYPAISLFLLPARPHGTIPEAVDVRVQLDVWFPSSAYNANDVLAALDRVRALLHRQNLSDTTIDEPNGLIVYQCLQTESGPMIYEDDTELFHLPSIFETVVK